MRLGFFANTIGEVSGNGSSIDDYFLRPFAQFPGIYGASLAPGSTNVGYGYLNSNFYYNYYGGSSYRDVSDVWYLGNNLPIGWYSVDVQGFRLFSNGSFLPAAGLGLSVQNGSTNAAFTTTPLPNDTFRLRFYNQTEVNNFSVVLSLPNGTLSSPWAEYALTFYPDQMPRDDPPELEPDPPETLLGDFVVSMVDSSGKDRVEAIGLGAGNAVYATGTTRGNLNGELNSGSSDIFVTKFNTDGTSNWTTLMGTRLIDSVNDLSVAADGSILVAATSQSGLNGAGFAGVYDAYVVKLNASGQIAWTNAQSTSGIDRGYGVNVDPSGNVYFVGQTQGRLDGQRNAGSYDAFLSKYDQSGTKVWTRMLGSTGIDSAFAVSASNDGHVYLAGSSAGALNGQPRRGGTDAFIAKYDAEGVLVWTRVFGTTKTDSAESIAVNYSDGSVYVAGYTSGAFIGQTSGGLEDAFLAKYSPAGALQWLQQFGSSKNDRALDVSLGTDGKIYVTGYAGGSVAGADFAGGIDAFVAKFSSSGNWESYQTIGSSEDEFGTSIVIDSSNAIRLGGYTNSPEFFGEVTSGGESGFIVSPEAIMSYSDLTVVVSGAGTPFDASNARVTYQITAGDYSREITNFAARDKIDFPNGIDPTVVNQSYSDGIVRLMWVSGGQSVMITLVGLTLEQDQQLNAIIDFNSLFGPGTIG